jgi:hypothetical protein
MQKEKMNGIASRRTALLLNTLIVSAYVAIATLIDSPWAMFASFLLLAVCIRCATLCWMIFWVSKEVPKSARPSLLFLLLNLVLGLLFSAGLVWGLWWLGRFWLSGIKVIMPFVAVFVAYKSTFPLWSWRQQSREKEPVSNKASDATSEFAPGADSSAHQG